MISQQLRKRGVGLSQAAARIRELAQEGAHIRFSHSAEEQMAKLDIERPDVLTVLKKCRVTEILGSSVGEGFHYRVQGKTTDQKEVVLRVRIEQPANRPHQLGIINVWCLEGGKP